MAIQFLYQNEIHTLADINPTQSVLDWVRDDTGRTGTKEGCNEGDCGACTVVVGELVGDKVRYRAVNSCIFFMPLLDGKELLTVEDMSRGNGAEVKLHPVQQAMIDNDGSQCGFCTPGLIMSLFAKYQNTDAALPENVDDVLAGNLCRCTGYASICRAVEDMSRDKGDVEFGGMDTITALRSLRREKALSHVSDHSKKTFEGQLEKSRFFAPQNIEELSELYMQYPDATLLAGGTDVGLWVTKQHKELETIISINSVEGLDTIREHIDFLEIGAAARYSDVWKPLRKISSDLGELVRRIGSVQVRNSGTIGGNIANGSPIGDTMPALIALDAQLVMQKGNAQRCFPLEDYFIEYGKQDRDVSEFVRAVRIPKPSADQAVKIYKISKRQDQDITAVLGAFMFTMDGAKIKRVRIAFGGMAGTPKRASHCEAALQGELLDSDLIEMAVSALSQDFAPLSDMRASSQYRNLVAGNLVRKACLEILKPDAGTRILKTPA